MPTSDSRIFECVHDELTKRLGESETQGCLSSIAHDYAENHLRKPNVDALAVAIEQCRTCKNATNKPKLGWWNWHDCDLLIVSSNSYEDERFVSELGRLLKESKFSSAFCGVIHATKCDFKEIESVNVQNCSSWLYDQIDVSRPKIIAPLGAQAFEFFKTNQNNFSSAVGSSWWWGIYKIYCLPPAKDFSDPKWKIILDDIYENIYGISFDTLDISK